VYRATSYLKSALWTVPLVAIAFELLLAPLIHGLDDWQRWKLNEFEPAGATALYQTVITLTLSFLVFTFGQLLVAIQIAGGQLTPRIIATILLRNNVVRYSVGLFVFTLVFAVGALNRQVEAVHQLAATVTGVLGITCIADFLFLIDYAARLLRPVAVVARVGDEATAMIKAVYPDPATALPPEEGVPPRDVWHAQPRGRAPRNIRNRPRGGHPHVGGAGADPRRHDRVSTAGRGFRRYGRAAVPAPWRRDGDRRPHRKLDSGLRSRTNTRAGSDVRVPHHRRHRAEGIVAGDQ
jgi:hypothetical protein